MKHLFLAISLICSVAINAQVTMKAYSVEPSDIKYTDTEKREKEAIGYPLPEYWLDSNVLVDPKPVLRVVFEGADYFEYIDGSPLETLFGDEYYLVENNTDDPANDNRYLCNYAYYKHALLDSCYILHELDQEVSDTTFIVVDNIVVDSENKVIVFPIITSDLQYIPSNTEFVVSLPHFQFYSDGQAVSVEGYEDTEARYEFKFKTKKCHVINGKNHNLANENGEENEVISDDELAEWKANENLPVIVRNFCNLEIPKETELTCTQLVVEAGSGIKIDEGAVLNVADTAYFVGYKEYNNEMRPYLINKGTFNNDDGYSRGRTVISHTLTTIMDGYKEHAFNFFFPVEETILREMVTRISNNYVRIIEHASSHKNILGETQVDNRYVPNKDGSYNQDFVYSNDYPLMYMSGINENVPMNGKGAEAIDAVIRFRGKINDEESYELKYYELNEQSGYNFARYLQRDFMLGNFYPAPVDIRKVYKGKKSDIVTVSVWNGMTNLMPYAYNPRVGITTYDGEMRKGYLVPAYGVMADNQHVHGNDPGHTIEATFEKDDLVSYHDVEAEEKLPPYIRFYVQEHDNPEAKSYKGYNYKANNRHVCAVYFLPQEKYDLIHPGENDQPESNDENEETNDQYLYDLEGDEGLGIDASRYYSQSGGAYMNLEYECTYPMGTGYGLSSAKSCYCFPHISISCHNGRDINIYNSGELPNDVKFGLSIKAMPMPEKSWNNNCCEGGACACSEDCKCKNEKGTCSCTADGCTCNKYAELVLMIKVSDDCESADVGILDYYLGEENDEENGEGWHICLYDYNDPKQVANIATYNEYMGKNTLITSVVDEQTVRVSGYFDFYKYEPRLILVPLKIGYGEVSNITAISGLDYKDNFEPEEHDIYEERESGVDDDGNDEGGDEVGDEGESGKLEKVSTPSIRVVTHENSVELRGVEVGSLCSVVDLSGIVVSYKTASSSITNLEVPKKGVYFVSVSGKENADSFKVLVK